MPAHYSPVRLAAWDAQERDSFDRSAIASLCVQTQLLSSRFTSADARARILFPCLFTNQRSDPGI